MSSSEGPKEWPPAAGAKLAVSLRMGVNQAVSRSPRFGSRKGEGPTMATARSGGAA